MHLLFPNLLNDLKSILKKMTYFASGVRMYTAGRLAQSEASLTANQGVAGSSPGPATFFR